MKQNYSSIDQLIDRIDLSDYERENTKIQVRRAEMIMDTIESCTLSVKRAVKSVKSLTAAKTKGAHQH